MQESRRRGSRSPEDDKSPRSTSNSDIPIGGIVWIRELDDLDDKKLLERVVSWPANENFSTYGESFSKHTLGRPAVVVDKHGEDEVGLLAVCSLHLELL